MKAACSAHPCRVARARGVVGTVADMQRFEYRVVQLRESLVGGKLSADKLEETLNDEARKGWMVRPSP
jgi:hypothetical protein